MAFQRYQAAKEAYDLALQLEEGEQTRLEYGDSTLFVLNQRERFSAQAKIKMIEAQADFQQSLVRMLAVTGQL